MAKISDSLQPPQDGGQQGVSLESPAGDLEQISIGLGGTNVGQATVRYEDATANVSAHVTLTDSPWDRTALDQFHHDFSRELIAFLGNRGSMAQESEGTVTYHLGDRAETLPLPSNQEVGVGYPNSW